MPFVNGIRQARERIVARTDEDRSDFLRKRGFGKAETAKIIETVLVEEVARPRACSTSSRASPPSPGQDPAGCPPRPRGPGKKLLDRAA
jgi:hypothetical protein